MSEKQNAKCDIPGYVSSKEAKISWVWFTVKSPGLKPDCEEVVCIEKRVHLAKDDFFKYFTANAEEGYRSIIAFNLPTVFFMSRLDFSRGWGITPYRGLFRI